MSSELPDRPTAEPRHLVTVGVDVTACGLTRPWDRGLDYTSALRLVTCARCRATSRTAANA